MKPCSINEMRRRVDNLISELLNFIAQKSQLYGTIDTDKLVQSHLNNLRNLFLNTSGISGYVLIYSLETMVRNMDSVADRDQYLKFVDSLKLSLLPFMPERKEESPANVYYNSEEFYKKEIEDIKREKLLLFSQIDDLKGKLSRTRQEADESEKYKAELLQKEKVLNEYIELTEKYEAERKEQEKINDSIKVWNEKIIKAFDTLKGYIKPIKKEHDRLSFLYWGYLGLSGILIICLAVIEYNICQKIISYNGIPTWEQYFSVVLPIPISLALLWGFIHEMNRSQRQLVILAKQIHEVEYVEGLLLTINTLSTDMNDSVKKINNAIDKLLENHLTYRDKLLLDEKFLKKEEGKDEMPYVATMKILKVVNELVSNKK